MTVHVLDGGVVLCGFDARTPDAWPDGHSWVGLDDAYRDCTCDTCNYMAGVLLGKTAKFIGLQAAVKLQRNLGDEDRTAHGCPFCRQFNTGRIQVAALLKELVEAHEAGRVSVEAALREGRAMPNEADAVIVRRVAAAVLAAQDYMKPLRGRD